MRTLAPLALGLLLLAGCGSSKGGDDSQPTPEPRMGPAIPAHTGADEPELVTCYPDGVPG